MEILSCCTLNGSISMYDMEIDQRPYHCNCSCALHKLKSASPNSSCVQKNILFLKKNSMNKCSLSLSASKFVSQSCFHGDSSVIYREYANEALPSLHRQRNLQMHKADALAFHRSSSCGQIIIHMLRSHSGATVSIEVGKHAYSQSDGDALILAEMMLQYITTGSLSVHNVEVKRRPYHKNCSCALHKLKGAYSSDCFHQKNIWFKKKNSWKECSLSLDASSLSSLCLQSSSSIGIEGMKVMFAKESCFSISFLGSPKDNHIV
ncbi:hypothetical protein LguiB_024440 [Lonicera macranthoides]